MQQFRNVGENWPLTDTVLIGTDQNDAVTVPGWYANLANLGAANKLTFYQQRTRANGLSWCNLDTRDQMPYPFIIKSMGIRFFATMQTEAQAPDIDEDWWLSNYVSHLFMTDLPRHCSVVVRIQQDEVLKTNAMLVPSGMGPCGGGYGRGSVQSQFQIAVDKSFGAISQSTAHLANRWKFATFLKVPRNAALSVELQFSEYAKQLLGEAVKYDTQDAIEGNVQPDVSHNSKTYYGIQATLMGERLVQQRGKWHA